MSLNEVNAEQEAEQEALDMIYKNWKQSFRKLQIMLL